MVWQSFILLSEYTLSVKKLKVIFQATAARASSKSPPLPAGDKKLVYAIVGGEFLFVLGEGVVELCVLIGELRSPYDVLATSAGFAVMYYNNLDDRLFISALSKKIVCTIYTAHVLCMLE